MKLNELRAVVTGGASGLGEATVRRIIASGGKAAIFDLNGERANKLAEEMGSGNVLYLQTDVTSTEQVEAGMKEVYEKFGSVNTLINCAGIATPGKVLSRKGIMELAALDRKSVV